MKRIGRSSRRMRSREARKTACPLGLERCEERVLLTAYVVDSAADDLSPGTLRSVLIQLNATGTATNTIDFAIGAPGSPATISLSTPYGALPSITRQVTINGLSQGGPGSSTVLVEIDLNDLEGLTFDPGSQGSVIHGLSIFGALWSIPDARAGAIQIDTDDVTVSGNHLGVRADGATTVVSGCGVSITGSYNTVGGSNVIGGNSTGIRIRGKGATANVVTGNFIGTNSSGALLANSTGVSIALGAHGNTIGPGNTIGFSAVGVQLTGPGTTGNAIQGNSIGTNASGANLGFGAYGVFIGGQASRNTIGPGNTIGFNQNGVGLDNAADNVVTGNHIGTNSSGANLGGSYGVLVYRSPRNTIGPDNTIGFNQASNVYITGPASTANTVLGNSIGTNARGANLGGTSIAVGVANASNNTIGPNNTIGFSKHGVYIAGPGATANVVTGSFIGTNSSGANLGNSISGVTVGDRAHDNTIGAGNTIGFNGIGIDLGPTATANVVTGNSIGTNPSGDDLGNRLVGVRVDGSSNNRVGLPGQGNTISGNDGPGIQVLGGSSSGSALPSDGNTIQDNRIGADWQVARALPNTIGVDLQGATRTQIGGSGPGEGNWISGNTVAGVSIAGLESTGNSVVANSIGTDFSGAKAIPNGAPAAFGMSGVHLSRTTGNTIGPRNLVSGNDGPGVVIDGGSHNAVFGNYIGTTAHGDRPLGNAGGGILVNESAFNVIGGTDPEDRNVISGSRFAFAAGVAIVGAGSHGNRVIGNQIGTNATGTAAIPNAHDGVRISGAAGNTIGGPGGERNLISGNGGVGVRIVAAPSSAAGNVVVNNFIGTNVHGAFAIPNAWDGILVNASSDNVIGQPGLGNLVSGNLGSGVHISGSTSTGNRVQANLIGTRADGAGPIANGGWGVLIQNARGNLVGGIRAGAGNVFGLNRNGGLVVFAGVFPLPAGHTGGNLVVGNQHRGVGVGGRAAPHGGHLVWSSRPASPFRVGAVRRVSP